MIRRSVIMAFGKTPSASTQFYRALTVDHLQVPSTQTNFTVLVSITDATLKTVGNGGHVQNSSGFDITFYSDSGKTTILKWEMEFYDPVNGIVVAWVKIASLASGSDTVFYMFYGDASITTDQSDKANTWDSNFKGVWHMNDNAASTTILESTTRSSNATNVANTSTKTVTGQIGSALTYNGTSDAASVAINLTATNVVTLSCWMKWTTNANDDDLAFEFTSNWNTQLHSFIVDWNNSGVASTVMFGAGQGAGKWNDTFTRPSAGAWHLAHFIIDKATPINKAYIDGGVQTLTAGTHAGEGAVGFANDTLYFMSRAAASLFGAGILDEVHLSITERSADWITCEFNNQKTSSTFVATGGETSF